MRIGMGVVRLAAVLCWTVGMVAGAPAKADPPLIHAGRQTAAEDNIWLMIARPDLATRLGKEYRIEWSQFRASDTTYKGLESGQVDLATASANSVILAASKGLELKLLASVSRETANDAATQFVVKPDGPKSITDLKGKTIGINGYRSSVELWARAALLKSGINPDKDVNWAVVPFPSMADAVRTGRVDAAGAPGVFVHTDLEKAALRTLFTSKTGVPFDEELIVVVGRADFVKQQPAATRAFLADLTDVTKFLLAHPQEARQALLDAKLVALPAAYYLAQTDYVHDPALRPDASALAKQQDLMLSLGFQEDRTDLSKLIDTAYLPAR